mgnify:CR=1 FL=1|jgi:hypothetical protein
MRQGRCLFLPLVAYRQHGSIAVQQVFEVFGNADLMVSPPVMMGCSSQHRILVSKRSGFSGFRGSLEALIIQILADISKVANNQFGQ